MSQRIIFIFLIVKVRRRTQQSVFWLGNHEQYSITDIFFGKVCTSGMKVWLLCDICIMMLWYCTSIQTEAYKAHATSIQHKFSHWHEVCIVSIKEAVVFQVYRLTIAAQPKVCTDGARFIFRGAKNKSARFIFRPNYFPWKNNCCFRVPNGYKNHDSLLTTSLLINRAPSVRLVNKNKTFSLCHKG